MEKYVHSGDPSKPPMPGHISDRNAGDDQPTPPTVVQQPQGVHFLSEPPIPENEAPDHLFNAILVTICLVTTLPCCLPWGILAIRKSRECRAARLRGDRHTALVQGGEAKRYIGIPVKCVIIIVVCVIVVYLIVKKNCQW